MIYFLNIDRVPHLCISTYEVFMGFELSFFLLLLLNKIRLFLQILLQDKYNICVLYTDNVIVRGLA